MRQFDLCIQSRRPWNASRLIGTKAALKPKHVPLDSSSRLRREFGTLPCSTALWIPNYEPVAWSGSVSATWCQAVRFASAQ